MVEAILARFGYIHSSRLPFGPNYWLDANEDELTDSGKERRFALRWQRIDMMTKEMRRLKISQMKVS